MTTVELEKLVEASVCCLISQKFHDLTFSDSLQCRLAHNEITVVELKEVFMAGVNAVRVATGAALLPLEAAELALEELRRQEDIL